MQHLHIVGVCAFCSNEQYPTDLDFSGLQSEIFTHIKADADFRDLQCQSFNNIDSNSDFSNIKRQFFITNKADSKVSQFLSSFLQLNKTSSAFWMMKNKHKSVIKNKMPSTFQLIVGSQQKYLRKSQQDLVNVWLLNAISKVKLQTTNDFQQGFASHFNNCCFCKLIVNSVSEGAQTPLSMLIVGCRYSKIFLHFCNGCRIFSEGVKAFL